MTTTTEDVRKNKPDIMDIPGEEGWPLIGSTLAVLKDPLRSMDRMYKTYGPVIRNRVFWRRQVVLAGAEGNEFLLVDKDRNFSSERGWGPFIGRLYPQGLMLRDFDDHRQHRRIMQHAFKTPAMKSYVSRLNRAVRDRLKAWHDTPDLLFYPAIKQLTLDIALDVFFGVDPDGSVAKKLNRAQRDMVIAAVTINRLAIPGTKFWRGRRGRQFMKEWLLSELPSRRSGTGDDMFSFVARAVDEDGNRFSDMDVVNHMNFLMLAAHDTVTSSLTTLVYQLARHPEWQQKIREECAGLGLNENEVSYERLGDLTLTECAFKEALRLGAPVPGIPRETVRDVAYKGYILPKGTIVGINPHYTHHMEEYWPDATTFDPLRFTEAGGVRERPKYAWIPYGGGAHMCIGLHFAYMQAKVFSYHLLTSFKVTVDDGYTADFQVMPIPKPKDGLPVHLEPIRG